MKLKFKNKPIRDHPTCSTVDPNFLRQTVFVAKLSVFPVRGSVSTSGSHLMLLSEVDNVDTGGSVSGVP